MLEPKTRYQVDLTFEEIKFPSFEDILLITRNGQYGKIGLIKSIELLVPNEFEPIPVDNSLVELLLVKKKIIKKMGKDNIIDVLEKHVFPYISESEVIKIDFKLKISYDSISLKP